MNETYKILTYEEIEELSFIDNVFISGITSSQQIILEINGRRISITPRIDYINNLRLEFAEIILNVLAT